MSKAYEIRNPSWSDMTLEFQIAAGINDWCVSVGGGEFEFFGRTKEEAEDAARIYMGERAAGN